MNKEYFEMPDLECHQVLDDKTGFIYLLFRNMKERFVTALKWDPMEFNDYTFWKSASDKVKTLLYNRVRFEDKMYRNEEDLLEFIEKNYPKYSPNEKLNNILEYIAGLTKYDGEAIDFDIETEIRKDEIWRKYYFYNDEEFLFYMENLKEQGLISYEETDTHLLNLRITLKGLTSVLTIKEQKLSRYCFVAMSFDSSLNEAYDKGIYPAIAATGFIPYIVRNENVSSEQTINDAIIAGIKKSRFTIADFTQHKAGVYFEAGYALGRGQKVIYMCRADEIGKAHFDTRNYQHIVWNKAEDLKQMLIDKITAFVLD